MIPQPTMTEAATMRPIAVLESPPESVFAEAAEALAEACIIRARVSQSGVL